MKTILFQGDSITDAGRTRDNDRYWLSRFCKGYINGFENPDEYTFFNRGISGNRVVDVYAIIKSDILETFVLKGTATEETWDVFCRS